jgi:hypothetical protein
VLASLEIFQLQHKAVLWYNQGYQMLIEVAQVVFYEL